MRRVDEQGTTAIPTPSVSLEDFEDFKADVLYRFERIKGDIELLEDNLNDLRQFVLARR